jgi:serine/threonine protein kinase
MLLQSSKADDSILGYTLRHKIGSGGYGEVWAAEAPGGLTKAVKLIYGYHDESRAQRELKALNRIKQVRHPFLLSLERIDIVGGRLVVVTELAERSLKDRFNECTDQGESGIPRAELLSYLTDAAEALDYIHESHSLLHLDVKPENLLILGGHIKLADFGLVKDIEETSQSMMGGLTPTYAAPEVFDGRPGTQSDQYSLAIVFQEMLTGHRPFSGTTPAKLALQHLHEVPDLNHLPAGDQGPIRRALAKSPDARFPSCRAMLDELSLRRARPPRRQKPELPPPRAKEAPSVDTFSHTVLSPLGGLTAMAKKRTQEKLPPLDVAIEDAKFRPALFIGVGHTATTVLRRLKRRLRERLGDTSQYQAIKILCLDTDSVDLNEALRAPDMSRLSDDEILPLPLKSPLEYRDNAESQFGWLSRRWIYNVPRSRQTEGLRPLGRLAFADHHQTVFSRLRRMIEQITTRDAVDRTARLCAMQSDLCEPKVYLVASISGGVGSGMVADLAYAVRTVLGERGLKNFSVNGFLLTGAGKGAIPRDIAVANAYCCLNEIYHYGYVRGFPGDATCDLPAFEDEPPFDATYFLDLGRELLPDEFAATTDGLAEYLFLDAATACGYYLDACRSDSRSIDEGMCVRTLGVSHSGSADRDAVSHSSRLVCDHLLRNWLRPVSDPAGQVGSASMSQELGQLEREWDQLANKLREVLTTRLECDPLMLIQRELEPFCRQSHTEEGTEAPKVLMRELEDAVDRAFGIDRYRPRPALNSCLRVAAEQIADELADAMARRIRETVFGQFQRPGQRLSQAETMQRVIHTRLEGVIEQTTAKHRQLTEQLAAVIQQLERGTEIAPSPAVTEKDDGTSRIKAVRQYGFLRLNDCLSSYVKRVLGRTRQQMESLAHQLMGIRRDLNSAVDQLDAASITKDRAVSGGGASRQSVLSSLLMDMTIENLDEMAATLDGTLSGHLSEENEFQNSQNDQPPRWQTELFGYMHRYARSVISTHVQTRGLEPLLRDYDMTDGHLAEWMHVSLRFAMPKLIESCGGKSRVIVTVPRGSQCDQLEIILATSETCRAKFLPVTDGDVTFCHEAGSIPVHQVAATLLQSCPRSTEIVGRIHSRIDVKWTPLILLE